MADSTIAGLDPATTIADDDVIPFTDISDTAEEPTGKTKKITKSNLVASGGDVVGPATHSASYVPQWDATPNSKTLIEGFTITAAGKALIDDADAAAQRTTLGLGTAATRAAEDSMTDGSNLPDGHAIKTYGDTNWSGGGVPAGSQGDMLYKGALGWLAIGGTYNVKAYGAVGDNSNDDTAGIQAAIDAAEAAGGGTVYFPSGTYKTSAQLMVDSNNIWLKGVGIYASNIKRAAGFTTGDTVEFNGVQRGGMCDMGLDASAAMTADAHIHLNGSAGSFGLSFTRLFINNGYIGMLLTGYSYAHLSECTIKVNGTYYPNGTPAHSHIKCICTTGTYRANAIHLDHCNLAIDNDGRVRYDMYITAMDGLWMDSCHLGGSKYSAMYFEPNAADGGTASNQLSGIRVNNSWFEMRGAEATTDSIRIVGTTTAAHGLINFSDCFFQGQTGAGAAPKRAIYVNSSTVNNIGIYNNIIMWHQQEGIRVDAIECGLNISGNEITSCSLAGTGSYDGIYIANGVDNFNITNNMIGSAFGGVATGATNYGIKIAGTSHTQYVVTGNNLAWNQQTVGIYDAGTADNKLVAGNLPHDVDKGLVIIGTPPKITWDRPVAGVPGTNQWRMYQSGTNALYLDGTASTTDLYLNPTGGNIFAAANIKLPAGKDFTVNDVSCCDHVFEDDYKIMPLDKLHQYVEHNDHLPNMTINKGGTIGIMSGMQELLVKTEEQALYILQLHQRLKVLEDYVH